MVIKVHEHIIDNKNIPLRKELKWTLKAIFIVLCYMLNDLRCSGPVANKALCTAHVRDTICVTSEVSRKELQSTRGFKSRK